MTDHGGNSRMIHSRVGAGPIGMRKTAEELKGMLTVAITCERPGRDYQDLHHVRGFMTKPPRHHARGTASLPIVRTSLFGFQT